MHGALFLIVIVTSHIAKSFAIPCQINNKNEIRFESQGEISLDNCGGLRDTKCACTWTFFDAPSEGNDLILNMTRRPASLDLITLNGDAFTDRCMILIKTAFNFSDIESKNDFLSLQTQYPACGIRAGIQNRVIVTYQIAEINIPFTIEYQITGVIPTSPPDTTTSSTEVVTSPIVTTLDNVESTTPDAISKKTSTILTPSGRVGGWNLPQTYTIAIVVGSLAVALIFAVFVMLFIIRKRHKENIQRENRLNIIYDSDINQYATVDDYKDIRNGKNGGFTKQDVIKEEVMNPLYSEFSDDSAPVSPHSPYPPTAPRTQNSYEYIDIEIGNR